MCIYRNENNVRIHPTDKSKDVINVGPKVTLWFRFAPSERFCWFFATTESWCRRL